MRRLPLILVLLLAIVAAALLVHNLRSGRDALDTAEARARWGDLRREAGELADGARGLAGRGERDLDRLRGDLERLERQAAELSARLEGARAAGRQAAAKAREIEREAQAARRQLAELQGAAGERAAALRDELGERLAGLERQVDELRRDVAAGGAEEDDPPAGPAPETPPADPGRP